MKSNIKVKRVYVDMYVEKPYMLLSKNEWENVRIKEVDSRLILENCKGEYLINIPYNGIKLVSKTNLNISLTEYVFYLNEICYRIVVEWLR